MCLFPNLARHTMDELSQEKVESDIQDKGVKIGLLRNFLILRKNLIWTRQDLTYCSFTVDAIYLDAQYTGHLGEPQKHRRTKRNLIF